MANRQPRVFISYRRRDTGVYAGWLYDRLCQQFGIANVFKDVDKLRPGVDFPVALAQELASCDVVLALIGEEWIGDGRIQQPGDYVRLEIESAFESGIKVIPILTSGVSMPDRNMLIPSLRPLLNRHAIGLSHESFESDLRRLVAAIDDIPGGDDGRRMGPTRESLFVEVERLYRAKVDVDVPPYKYDPLIKAAARRSELDRLVKGLEDGERPANLALAHFSTEESSRTVIRRGLIAVTPRRIVFAPHGSEPLHYLPFSQIVQVDLGMTRTGLTFTLAHRNISATSFKPWPRAGEFATYIRERLIGR
jgi:hypothetical protein